ncbi:hypothetical protein RCO48_13425 [Peribacillus frigoritolerans]|nr:hypothetical protein [Peribacillus frigoritolerans]
MIKSFGYKRADGTTGGAYPDMLKKLDNMTAAFVNEFNAIHKQGYALGDGNTSTLNFFELEPGKSAAQSIKVNGEIVKDPTKIAAGGKSGGHPGIMKMPNSWLTLKRRRSVSTRLKAKTLTN